MSQQQIASQDDAIMSVINNLNMPISLSGETGAVWTMEERVRRIREIVPNPNSFKMGSCYAPWNAWSD